MRWLLLFTNPRAWWETRHCDHINTTRSSLIDFGRAKAFWCIRCQRRWFA